ncbi:MAG TPA: HlyD family efflux transporter periplasmic adaptor subunit [Gemmatimonadales bacterium]|nr:HlyD family efflux transporter periplasmic adaptor subunit [Gemmatimonadales bacterium]
MDIPREPVKNRRRFLYLAAAIVAVVAATVGLSRLKPAAPSVELGTLWMDTVRKGPMVREVRGPGTLVPEQIRWISAVTPGRVDRVLVQPGVMVDENTLLLELSNPDVQIQSLQAQRELTAAEAELISLKTNLEAQRLSQAGAVATAKSAYREAQRKAKADSDLVAQNLISTAEAGRSGDQAEEMTARLEIEEKRLQILTDNMKGQLDVQQAQVDRLRAIAAFQRRQVESMVVRAGASGVLQELPMQVGQWAISGATLAKVVRPEKLKAVLRIPETQAPDVTVGQVAAIDTRNGIVKGHVVRMDPASQNGTVTVDVTLDGTLPKGARPDLSVDGTIEIERLSDVLHVGRPAYGQANSTVGIFRMVAGTDEAERVQVGLGRSSVNTIEVLRGLNEGDVVILSDMSRWDAVDRVRVK